MRLSFGTCQVSAYQFPVCITISHIVISQYFFFLWYPPKGSNENLLLVQSAQSKGRVCPNQCPSSVQRKCRVVLSKTAVLRDVCFHFSKFSHLPDQCSQNSMANSCFKSSTWSFLSGLPCLFNCEYGTCTHFFLIFSLSFMILQAYIPLISFATESILFQPE